MSPTLRERVRAQKTNLERAPRLRWYGRVIPVISALGVVVVSYADYLSRRALPHGELLFWIGLALIFFPLVAGLLSTSATRGERIALCVGLGVGVYLVNVLVSPIRFTQFAEMDELRTLEDMLASHHLFQANPIALVNPYFPGLPLVADALVKLTGISTFLSGVIVAALSRTLLTVGLFRIFELAVGSARLAGIAVAIYATNPNFLQFSTQFSYETLGLAFFVMTLLALSHAQRSAQQPRAHLVMALVMAAALIITHHITSYILIAVTATWTILSAVLQTSGWRRLAGVTILVAIGAAAWLVTIGRGALSYLGNTLGPAVTGAVSVVDGGSTAKVPFHAANGVPDPLWLRAAGFASVGLLLVTLPLGLLMIWRLHRRQPFMVLIALIAAAYPASLVLRLTQAGSETSGRASDFVFIGLGLLLGAVVASMLHPARVGTAGLRRLGTLAMMLVLFVGGISIGTPRYTRQPGPYIVGSDSRTVEPLSLAAAEWMKDYEGVHNRMLTDRSNRQIMGSYGEQDPQTLNGGPVPGHEFIPISELISSKTFGPIDVDIIHNRRLRFVEIDRRLSTALPVVGIYFEASEPGAYHHTQPLSLEALAKFDRIPEVDRVFDDGPIQLYDVSGVPLTGDSG